MGAAMAPVATVILLCRRADSDDLPAACPQHIRSDCRPILPVELDVLSGIEVSVDVEEVADLLQLVFRQLRQVMDVTVGRVTHWHAHQLGFRPWPVLTQRTPTTRARTRTPG